MQPVHVSHIANFSFVSLRLKNVYSLAQRLELHVFNKHDRIVTN